GTGSRGGVPEPQSVAMADGLRKRPARRRQGVRLDQDPRRARRLGDAQSQPGADGACQGQAAVRSVRWHEFCLVLCGAGLGRGRRRKMTPEQVNLVQQSFAKVVPISEQAAVLFYDRLFEVAPSVKATFPADMAEQRK